MVRKTYIGVRDPKAELDALRPALDKLRSMQAAFHPNTPQYRGLHAAQAAFREAADVVANCEDFYHMTSSDGATGARRGGPYRGPLLEDPSRRGWAVPVVGKLQANGEVEMMERLPAQPE